MLLPHSGPIRHLTVHHAGSQSGTIGPERFRSWQQFHITERGWGDLAYHIIIGVGGDVFAGRDLGFRGDTATDYDPDRHFLVVVEGNFNDDLPTPQQLDSLRVVLAWASQTLGVPPDAVRGHADWAATSCPGDNLSPYVRDRLAADAQAILDEGVVTVVT